jgi:hypothetical protein
MDREEKPSKSHHQRPNETSSASFHSGYSAPYLLRQQCGNGGGKGPQGFWWTVAGRGKLKVMLYCALEALTDRVLEEKFHSQNHPALTSFRGSWGLRRT